MHKNTTVADRASKIADLKIQDLGRRAVAERLGCSEKQARYALEYLRNRPVEQPAKAEKPKPVRISSIAEISADIRPGKVHRYILTSAQDDTPVFKPFLDNLHAYAAHLNAPLMVAGYTYQKGLFEDHGAATAVFDPELRDYLVYDRVRLSDELLFVADANVLPTAANPLTGWQTTNGGRHVVVPHARVALESIPRMLDQQPRFAISTGCCTLPSYAPRAAGRKAIQHHTYGALLIEIDTDGEIFFGQLIADERGSFQDLDVLVSEGSVKSGYRVSTIAWGDIHHDQLDQTIAMASWGYDRKNLRFVKTPNLLDRLKPFGSFLHDTLDFRWRNHHNIHDPIAMSLMAARGTVSVEREIAEAVAFANGVRRPWCNTIVVESNHDSAVAKWLRGDEGRYDPENAHTWHRLNADWHDSIRAANDNFNVTEHAFRKFGLSTDIQFSPAGGSIVVSEVEHGLHGDLGIGGSRGSPLQYRRFGRRVTSAHTHSPRIADGSYVAGVSAQLYQGYNVGPTTWAHAHVILYPNGNRAMVIMAADGRYRARGAEVMLPLVA